MIFRRVCLYALALLGFIGGAWAALTIGDADALAGDIRLARLVVAYLALCGLIAPIAILRQVEEVEGRVP